MARTSFSARLGQWKKVGLDTSIFRLYLQGDERHGALTMALFDGIERGRLLGVAATVALQELLVDAYREKNEQTIQDFNVLLPTFPNLALVPLTPEIADKAASYQARLGWDPSTSIQVATAAVEGANAFITGSRGMGGLFGELEIIVIEEYL
jgi:predicted nucleic acid-binding protein